MLKNEKLISIRTKLQKVTGKIQKNSYVQAVSNGMMSLLPIMMVGSIASVLMSLNIETYQIFLTSSGIKGALDVLSTMTMDIISIFVVISLSNKLAASFKVDTFIASILSLMSFFIVTPFLSVEKVKTLDLAYIGSKGMIVGMIVALVATRCYVWLDKERFKMKLPESVPTFVSKSFNSLVPAFVIGVAFIFVNILMGMTQYNNIHDLIYAIIQLPLQKLGASLPAALLLVFMAEFLWFFGIHGSMVTSAILYTLFYQFDVANLEAFKAGTAIPFIVTMTFINMQKGPRYLAMSILLLRSKSQQMKSLGKLGLIPSMFNVSEPYKFGLPMVLNPTIFIPLTLTGTINVALSYAATVLNIIPRVNGLPLPSAGTPEIIKGFMMGGWKMMLWHVFLLFVCMAIYYPFLKMMDKQKLFEESNESSGGE